MPERYPNNYVTCAADLENQYIVNQDELEAIRNYDLTAAADELQGMIDVIHAESLQDLISDKRYAQIAERYAELVKECPLFGVSVRSEGLWHSFVPSTADYSDPTLNGVSATGYFTGIVTGLAIGERRNYEGESIGMGLMLVIESSPMVRDSQTRVDGIICSPIASTNFEYIFPYLN